MIYKNVKSEAHQWLINRDITKWSLVHDSGIHCKAMTTNALEILQHGP